MKEIKILLLIALVGLGVAFAIDHAAMARLAQDGWVRVTVAGARASRAVADRVKDPQAKGNR